MNSKDSLEIICQENNSGISEQKDNIQNEKSKSNQPKENETTDKFELRKNRFGEGKSSLITTENSKKVLLKQLSEEINLKKELRAKKFGILPEQSKIQNRLKKFGLESQEEKEKKKQDRIKKFGQIEQPLEDLIIKRKNKFAVKEDLNETEKKKKRLERFHTDSKGPI